jgi:hypothetical protein
MSRLDGEHRVSTSHGRKGLTTTHLENSFEVVRSLGEVVVRHIPVQTYDDRNEGLRINMSDLLLRKGSI